MTSPAVLVDNFGRKDSICYIMATEGLPGTRSHGTVGTHTCTHNGIQLTWEVEDLALMFLVVVLF